MGPEYVSIRSLSPVGDSRRPSETVSLLRVACICGGRDSEYGPFLNRMRTIYERSMYNICNICVQVQCGPTTKMNDNLWRRLNTLRKLQTQSALPYHAAMLKIFPFFSSFFAQSYLH